MAPCRLLMHLCLALSGVALVWTTNVCSPNTNLLCHTDYEHHISCEWCSEHKDECSVRAQRLNINNSKYFSPYTSECKLEPTDEPTDKPGLRTCLLLFNQRPKSFYVLQLNLTCVHRTPSYIAHFEPRYHIKLEAPGKPLINGSSLSWAPPRTKSLEKMQLEYELHWRPQQQPWTDARVKLFQSSFHEEGRTELHNDSLLLHHRYSARVRARVHVSYKIISAWSDWSPTASWESAVGKKEDTPGPESWMWRVVIAGSAAFALMLVFILFRTERGRWVYMMKMIKGQSLPHPAESILKMQTSTSSPFSSQSYLSFFKPVDIIASVEVKAPDFRDKAERHLLEDSPSLQRPLRPNLSSFSNPMYSQLCPLVTPESCSTDSPHRPLKGLLASNDPSDPQREEEPHMGPELDISLFLSIAQQSQGVSVICEYEKVEAVGEQGERIRLHSVDSGVGSGEEVSQESLLVEEHTDVQDQPQAHTWEEERVWDRTSEHSPSVSILSH